MQNNSYTITFYLNKLKPKGNKYPIYVRITVNRRKVEFAIKEYLLVEQWDETSFQAIKIPRVNQYITKVENRLNDIRVELERDGKVITAKAIKDKFLGIGETGNETFKDYVETFIEEMRALKGDYSEGTLKNYIATRNHLFNFLSKHKKEGILMKEINGRFINDFDFFLMTERRTSKDSSVKCEPINRNTANKYHAKLRAILNKARKAGLIKINAYENFKLKDQKSNRTFLTEEELELIQKCTLSQQLERSRDIFLFSAYTGLRFNDAIGLTVNNISIDKDNTVWINIVQEKTMGALSIPMLKYAVDIYNKYKTEREITGRILPKISNQKLNENLKSISKIAGIKKPVTHHVARHTFATTVTLSNNVPIEIVSKMLGHSDLKTTQIYAKITNKYLSKIATELNSKI